MLPKIAATLIVASVIGAKVIPVAAQAQHPIPHPQAMTQEEFDSYADFLEAADPEARHELALRFEQRYAKSEFLVNVYESEFEYARSHEQLQPAVAAGEKALQFEPDDVKVLVDLAEVLPNGTSDPVTLSRAEQYARRAFVELNEMRFSHDVPLSGCENMRNTLLSRAHAALGEVLGKRGEYAEGIKELESAVTLSPEPSGSQLLLAGRLYRLAKRNQEAIEMFRRAAEAGPAAITLLANSELNQVSHRR